MDIKTAGSFTAEGEPDGRLEMSERLYRPMSGTAVAGLVMALISPVAFLHPVLWIVPLVAVALCLRARWSIQRSYPSQAGSTVALLGLVLSGVTAAAVPARLATRHILLERQCRQLMDDWLTYLRRGEPQKAYQLTVVPERRAKLDDSLWDVYRSREDDRKKLKMFTISPPVATLLSLRDLANVRYYRTERRDTTLAGMEVARVYAVTFPREGKPTTYFMRVTFVHTDGQKDQGTGWRIVEKQAPYRPAEWRKD